MLGLVRVVWGGSVYGVGPLQFLVRCSWSAYYDRYNFVVSYFL